MRSGAMDQRFNSRRALWFLWVSSTAFGLGVGAGLAELVSSAITGEGGFHLLFSLRWQVVVGFCFGAPAVLLQYLVVRAFVPGASRWIAATTLGLVVGAVVGAFAGLGAGMVMLALGVGYRTTVAEVYGAGFFFLTFPAAGAAAGALAGSIMGTLLRTGKEEWSQGWTWPLVKAWAGAGAVFWLVGPVLTARQLDESGLLDTTATLSSITIAGVAGIVAGLAGGALAAGHFVRPVGR
ncbi:MAG: hypothetical protein OXL97_14365 [Chloroflexota bacterium]|nr:hypothetical protein [Chloroflexota bacterium]MDE2883742.1 hypothetical protein [Chloroflexota bacterium]